MSASAYQAATHPTLAMVAGETSGDLLASLMIRGLRARWPQAKLVGIGGPRMAEQGFEAWWPHEKLAVRGYVEVLRHYREIVGIRSQLKARLLANPPQIFVGVDAPDFNLDLARDLRQAGIPTVQFVCPSIWAWRPERVEKIRQSVDHVLCLFPFEPALLAQHGISATYVGHPLAQTIAREPDRAAARLRLGLALDATVVALLPGSRASEIQYLAPRFLQAAQRMAAQRPGLRFVLPAVPSLRQVIDRHVVQVGGVPDLQVLDGKSHDALAACDVSLVASGTATLEAALFKRPMVIAYNMHWLSWWLMKGKKLQPWVGLPNILCQSFVVPELLQDKATPDAMAHGVLAWLDQPEQVRELTQRFTDLHDQLLRDTPTLSSHAIESLLAR
ncbi:MAG: lipid-A-disaccharide synthase [Limnohabitans sp.]|nr:lipid-A-disaccharide synthase [Limnohabitans sp.]